MCALAQMSKHFVCILAECEDGCRHAQLAPMAKQPKSAAVAEYRRQIALYLEAVRNLRGWKNVEMGQKAGGIVHTTIGRALKGENTLGFPALLALEAASGVVIPTELRNAAISAQQPTRVDEDRIERVAQNLTRSEREELLRRLQQELSKAS